MIIGFDASRAFVEGRTGTENYSFQLLKHLSLIDTENRYLIYLRSRQLSAVSRQEWPGNFEFVEIGLPRLWTQIGLAVRTFIDPLDVLFVPSHTLPLIRRPGLKTVITVHDLGAEYLPGFHQLKQVLYLNLMTHYQLKTADKIIAVSEATKEDVVKRVGIKKGKVEVVYEGVDRQVFSRQSSALSKAKTDSILKRYDIERDRYFIFVGTIQPRKNLERLIKAFAKFLTIQSSIFKKPSSTLHHLPSEFKLVLVGQKGWKSEEIYDLPSELGIEDKVRFLGRVEDKELVGLYNGALGLTYPSLFEGFGLPILEAFSVGCPVITSNISSMPEIAERAAILVNPEKVEEITQAMQELAINDILRESLIKKGIVRSNGFDWKKTAKQTIEILTKIK